MLLVTHNKCFQMQTVIKFITILLIFYKENEKNGNRD